MTSIVLVFALQMLSTLDSGSCSTSASGPKRPVELAILVVFGGLAFAGLGFGAAALIRSAEGASAVVNLAVLPMAFLSGSFGPTRDYPECPPEDLRRAAAHVLQPAAQRAYLFDRSIFDDPKSLAIVAAWGLGGYLARLAQVRLVAARALSATPARARYGCAATCAAGGAWSRLAVVTGEAPRLSGPATAATHPSTAAIATDTRSRRISL